MPKKGLENTTKTRYAFVNFCDARLARDMIMKLNGQEVTFSFGEVSHKCFLEVTKAKEQGLEANLAINSDKALYWFGLSDPKMCRMFVHTHMRR
jgi:hypothetical protein